MNNDLRYKSYKNKLNHTLRLAKCLYFEKKLEDAKSNTHATWKILNEILKAHLHQDSLRSFVFVLNLFVVQTRDLIG